MAKKILIALIIIDIVLTGIFIYIINISPAKEAQGDAWFSLQAMFLIPFMILAFIATILCLLIALSDSQPKSKIKAKSKKT